ncbi:hypothetical protein SMKI_08G1680 [Saccharomyces mikatae IFO 1815]|uniref:Uncharacterized protein n=1 Tax=Saccharomyces mikatae IFO 1815 TaxID=226126 RepID=A0AA35J127_SACMI|nr:uncharacterized protein SMKI_08G1680 [Saccharomyces mikatae IFO 1815]CAI4039501.1 hypothetical protein SMKI_08G1680 [Saccharomyces mikatae IFO 1815]
MKYAIISALFVTANTLVANAQGYNSSDTLYAQFSNDTNSSINGGYNTTNGTINSTASWPVEAQQKKIDVAAVYDVGGWNGSLYRSNRSVVADYQPVRKQDAVISQISDGQIQATASVSTSVTDNNFIPSNSTYISSYEGAGVRMEPKNVGCIFGLAALLFL